MRHPAGTWNSLRSCGLERFSTKSSSAWAKAGRKGGASLVCVAFCKGGGRLASYSRPPYARTALFGRPAERTRQSASARMSEKKECSAWPRGVDVGQ